MILFMEYLSTERNPPPLSLNPLQTRDPETGPDPGLMQLNLQLTMVGLIQDLEMIMFLNPGEEEQEEDMMKEEEGF